MGYKMKITKRQLRRIIKEAISDLTYGSQRYYTDTAGKRQLVPAGPSKWQPGSEKRAMSREIPYRDKYFAWVRKNGHATPMSSSVLASYVIDANISNEEMRKIAAQISVGPRDVEREIKLQGAEI